jgi:hypothetical protein
MRVLGLGTAFTHYIHYFTRFPGNFHYQDCIRPALILGQYRNSNIPNSGWEVGNQDEDGPLDVIPIKMQDQKIRQMITGPNSLNGI